MEQGKRLTGVYLVPDPLMLKPNFGPSEHIRAGFDELSKRFNMHLVVLGEYSQDKQPGNTVINTKGKGVENGMFGLMRDLKLLANSNTGVSALIRKLDAIRPDFIYERGQYLDFRGLRAAGKLNIAHYYEVNWLNFLGIRQFYRSWFNPVARRLEEWSYRKSRLNFFIGTQHKLINIPGNKVFTIQNGIEEDILALNEKHANVADGVVNICYVANLMPHHRFDVFLEALQKCEVGSKIYLHLIGYNFEQYMGGIPKNIAYTIHGPKKKNELGVILRDCNVGLISGGPPYSSFMKLFEYAAYKLCVVCPDLENIMLMFNDREIGYFKTDDPDSLAKTLNSLVSDPTQIPRLGESIYQKVKQKYTWGAIYEEVSRQITKTVGDD